MTALAGNECPSGYYCESKADLDIAGEYYEKKPCPAGTYFASTGATSAADCTPCDDGKYCESPGLSAVSGDCVAGYFCAEGASSPKPYLISGTDYGPCPVGYYCTDGTSSGLTACPAGKLQTIFNDNYATYGISESSLSSADTSCLSCPPGYYCGSTGMTGVTDFCGVGYYCPKESTAYEPPTTYCQAKQFCP